MKLFINKRSNINDDIWTNAKGDKETQRKRLSQLLSKVQKRREKAKKNKEALKNHAALVKAEKKIETLLAAGKGSTTRKKSENKEEPSSEKIEKDETLEAMEVEEKDRDQIEKSSAKHSWSKAETGQPEGFTVIGKDHFRKVKEAKAVLPKWLAQPTIICADMQQELPKVEDLPNLAPYLKNKLLQEGVTSLFPVQQEVIPWLLQEFRNSLTSYWPRDLCVSAPTGSGKTLAFALPVIQALKPRLVREIRALVVLPVQDLAKQVYKVFQTYCEGTGLKVVLATGQGPLSDEQRQLVINDACGYRAMADIVITTPGRLVHHLRDTQGLNLRHLRFLVVDEADRVMDGVQSDWLYHLDKHMAYVDGSQDKTGSNQHPCQAPSLTLDNLMSCKPPPQKLLFSATLSQDPEKLAQLGLFQPKLFTCIVKSDKKNSQTVDETSEQARGDFVGKFAMPAEIQEHYILYDDEGAKPLLLHCLLVARAEESEGNNRTLCFAASRLAAHRLALLLTALSNNEGKQQVKVAEITANLRLSERDNILSKFAKGEIDVIVSTDALARGIDIPEVDCVVSYDAPKQAKLYVHRTGRTGRAGRKGVAITLLHPQQLPQFEHMIRCAGKQTVVDSMPAPIEKMEELETEYLTALASIKKIIKVEEEEAVESSKVTKTATKSKKKKNVMRKKVRTAKKNLGVRNKNTKLKTKIQKKRVGNAKKSKGSISK